MSTSRRSVFTARLEESGRMDIRCPGGHAIPVRTSTLAEFTVRCGHCDRWMLVITDWHPERPRAVLLVEVSPVEVRRMRTMSQVQRFAFLGLIAIPEDPC